MNNNGDNNIDDEILRMVIEESLNTIYNNNDADYMKAIQESLNDSVNDPVKDINQYDFRLKYNDNFMKNTLSRLENFKNLLNNFNEQTEIDKNTEINKNTENIQVKKEHLTLEELRAARLKKFTNKN